MGCDIHFVVEKKFGGRWVGVYATWETPLLLTGREALPKPEEQQFDFMKIYGRAPVMKNRNYEFFANLAGVRGDGPDPRGHPEDMSELATLLLADDTNLHSHSWCSLYEFCSTWLLSSQEDETKARAVAAMLGEPKGQDLLRFVTGDIDQEDAYRVLYAFDN